MWVHCLNWDRRHIAGANHRTMCGTEAEMPYNYLRIDLEKCNKCQAEIERKRKEAKDANPCNG